MVRGPLGVELIVNHGVERLSDALGAAVFTVERE
jgi:hypothetical protein